jgi:hypothetical protein
MHLAPPAVRGGLDRRIRRERWLGLTGLIAALAALPLPTTGHSPELAATLAIGSIALLAGHRWGLAVMVLAEILLIGAVWPLAILARPPSTLAQIAVGVSVVGAVPGLRALGRAAAELVELVGARRTRRATRVAHAALAATALVVWTLPLF